MSFIGGLLNNQASGLASSFIDGVI
jgi:hypothetical protein